MKRIIKKIREIIDLWKMWRNIKRWKGLK